MSEESVTEGAAGEQRRAHSAPAEPPLMPVVTKWKVAECAALAALHGAVIGVVQIMMELPVRCCT